MYTDIISDYVKAGSQTCSPQLLADLAHHQIDRIRLRVAENPRTPADILALLACDNNVDVRIAVGSNPSTPLHISSSLALDEDANVRLGLAEDIETPIELLDKLTEDSNPYVSCKARQTKELLASRSERKNSSCGRFFRWASKGADQPEFRFA